MKTISVGELRQNPTRMLDEVEAGQVYILTRHNREVARIVPSVSSATLIPPKRTGRSHTSELPRVELPDGMSMDELLDEVSGEW
ncbi:type II toxin-antitoxin system Phd/YefM family antitoxin [Flexivirga caeni]|uniref:Antitoxin n=1 Tax=Flexivirga caeni TaxID=2294115 RepID=A0A3M9MCD7_9MICO|nr:type II toxin-antitoxin system Phd/YefM family antitoxin [Flexivirga caeni]RNI23229.1 type II toxin-antitoxin system Phd/YefM family antitoxin [Flexivirga caeni]